MRLLITRPETDALPLAETLRARGHEAVIEPLLTIDYLDLALNLEGICGVLITSAAGIRALARLSGDRRVPVYAVGSASAATARELGYRNVHTADGDVHALADLVTNSVSPDDGILFHAAGSTLAGDLKALLEAEGFTIFRTAIYHARTATALSDTAADLIAAGGLDGVLLYSPRTARTFVRLLRDAGLEEHCRTISAYCLSRAVADAIAGLPWHAVHVAAQPTQADLLRLPGL
ncbi:MAG TPA: uroporphyrinogen-III synthase [Alphaproteobacteria bacterium]|nr:uroporphyrinogen-III synthase [Alphaproteobacteria bacterium]HCO90089.1 uroporphyrinogen-III synthase [Alphaproteobacteria bacterium]